MRALAQRVHPAAAAGRTVTAAQLLSSQEAADGPGGRASGGAVAHKAVIVGAGYSGLPAARRLARHVRLDEVTVRPVNASAHFVERPRWPGAA